MRIIYRVWCKNRNEWEKDMVALLPDGRILHFDSHYKSYVILKEGTHEVVFNNFNSKTKRILQRLLRRTRNG